MKIQKATPFVKQAIVNFKTSVFVIFLCSIGLCSFQTGQAFHRHHFQQTDSLQQTVRGTIVDIDADFPIPGANILIVGSEPLKGTSSDAQGRFKIENVGVGRIALQITFTGYQTVILPNLTVQAGKELVLKIQMRELVTQLGEVEVTSGIDKSKPLNEMALISAKSFTVEEASRYAGSFNDPARMASSYAGVVSSQDDAENAIIVRGNSPRGLLWRLEGVEIPNPNHFASDGASNGAISMINSNVLANSDFLTGAFPAEYGNALSGVFDLKLRNGNNEKREYAIQAGLLGLDVSLEGPIRSKNNTVANASYLVNYRYSTISILESLGIIPVDENSPAPTFQDLNFKLHLPTSNAGSFSFWGIAGVSSSKDTDDVLAGSQLLITADDEDYSLAILGLNHVLNVGQKSFLESGLSFTRSRFEALNEGVINGQIVPEDVENYTNRTVRLNSSLTHKFNARHSSKFGLILTRLSYELNSSGVFLDGSPRYNSNESGNTLMSQAFWSHKFNLSNKLTFTGGLHYTRLELAGQQSLEPRLALRWQFKPKQALSVGFGQHSRREEMSLYLTELFDENGNAYQPNRELEFTKARHFVVGYDLNFGRNFHAKLEAYYQELYDVPIENRPFSTFSILNADDGFVRTPLINRGTGKNVGLELTLEKFLTRGHYFLLTASVFDSKYKAGSGRELNTRYNGNYQLNLVGGKEFSLRSKANKTKTFSVGIEGIFSGGRRIIPVNIDASFDLGRTVLDYQNAYSRQLDDYSRLDLQFALRTNKKRKTYELKLDIQNVGGNLYPTGEIYIPGTRTTGIPDFLGDLIPVLSYKIIF